MYICNERPMYISQIAVFTYCTFWLRTIVFIFIVISTTFQLICPPTSFRCLSNSETFTELRTTSFIKSTGVACSDSISHNLVQVLSIPVLLLACCQDWTCNLQMIVSLGNRRLSSLFQFLWFLCCCFFFYSISTFVGYLMPKPSLKGYYFYNVWNYSSTPLL